MEEIKVIIKKNGMISYKVGDGVVGANCFALTAALDAMCNDKEVVETDNMHKTKEDDNDLTSLGS